MNKKIGIAVLVVAGIAAGLFGTFRWKSLLNAVGMPIPVHSGETPGKHEETDHGHEDKDGHGRGKESEDGHDHEKKGRSHEGGKAVAGKEHSHEGEKEKKESSSKVVLTAKQRELVRIETAKAETGRLEDRLELHGEIRLNMDRTANLMPRMPGFVTAVEVSEGSKVKKGQVLVKMTSHKLGEYNSGYHSALELEKVSKSELEMAEALVKQNSMSKKDYLRYKRDYADAVIAREKAETLLNSLSLSPHHEWHSNDSSEKGVACTEYEIVSPFDGVVLKKDITVGENFAEDNTKVVLVVSDLRNVWLDLRASHQELRKLRPGMDAKIIPADSDVHFSGKIIYVAPVVDETTRTGLVRVLLPNDPGWLRPGEFASGIILAESKGDRVLVQSDAVQILGGESVVFVPEGKDFSPREIRTGKTVGGVTEILSGLAPGENYVTQGAFELKSMVLTQGIGAHAGHGH